MCANRQHRGVHALAIFAKNDGSFHNVAVGLLSASKRFTSSRWGACASQQIARTQAFDLKLPLLQQFPVKFHAFVSTNVPGIFPNVVLGIFEKIAVHIGHPRPNGPLQRLVVGKVMIRLPLFLDPVHGKLNKIGRTGCDTGLFPNLITMIPRAWSIISTTKCKHRGIMEPET